MTYNTCTTVIRGPKGIPISINDLPDGNTSRWVPHRKALVASAVRGGLLTLENAAERYRLSEEELNGWISQLPPIAGTPVSSRI